MSQQIDFKSGPDRDEVKLRRVIMESEGLPRPLWIDHAL
jgi:hypothetical protein